MAIGVFVNSVAQVPSALIQALGRPDLKAKIHIIELPLFIPLLYFLLGKYGILGAALAFTSRMIVDFTAFMTVAGALYKESIGSIKWAVSGVSVGTAALLMPLFVDLELSAKNFMSVTILLLFALLAWSRLLNDNEWTVLTSWLR